MPIVCLIIVTKQRVFVKRCMEVLFILININRVGKENMKLWITFEFDTDKETLLKGKSKKEIVELRIKMLEKQEEKIKEKADKIQKEVLKEIKE